MIKSTTFTLALAASAAIALAENPAGEGWVSLFDGKTLDGWVANSEDAKKIWSVVDGTIDCNPIVISKEDRNLQTAREYKDFVLSIDWRIKELKGAGYPMNDVQPDGADKLGPDGKPIIMIRPNADSGIYLRGFSKAQINIWCWPVGSGEMYGYRRDKTMPPEVRAGVTPRENADKPVGEWNTFVITLKGNHVITELNGRKVCESDLPGLPEAGPLVLQTHGGYDEKKKEWNSASSLVQFRNIKIKELK